MHKAKKVSAVRNKFDLKSTALISGEQYLSSSCQLAILSGAPVYGSSHNASVLRTRSDYAAQK